MPRPSFARPNNCRHQQTSANVDAPISSSHMPGLHFVIARPFLSPNVDDDEKIVEEKAICNSCFDVFKEENAFQTICGCGKYLIHEGCAHEWSRERNNNCNGCMEEVLFVAVMLSRMASSARVNNIQEGENKHHKKRSFSSQSMRILQRISRNLVCAHQGKHKVD